jgi:hypothetical protein
LAPIACTIDVGRVPDAAPCAASPDVFVQSVWPRYLAASSCGLQGCHDFSDGHGYFRLRQPEIPPFPGLAVADWPTAWRENYLATIQLLDCQNPARSRVLVIPEGEGNLHPPGPVVRDRATALAVLQAWVAGP